MVYADNAATTKMSRTAIDAMLPYMETHYGNPSSLYRLGQEAAEALQSARETVAACLGCTPREITFTSGGSEADNQALISAARIGERKGKKHIISTAFEHHAILHTLKKLEKEGFEVELLPVGPTGTVTAQQAGQAVLTATTASGLQASCTITVQEQSSQNEQTGSVSLTINPLTLNPGDEGQLQYSVNPAGTQLSWSSSNPRVADVDDNGYVTTIVSLSQTTNVTITATAADGSSAQTTVTVLGSGGGSSSGQTTGNTQTSDNTQGGNQQNEQSQSGYEGDLGLYAAQSYMEVESGYTKLIDLYVDRPEGEVTVECSSSDRNVARVDDEGMVTGVGPGDATITITATDVNTGEYQTITVDVSVSGGGGYGTSDPTPDEGESRPSGGYGTSDDRG